MVICNNYTNYTNYIILTVSYEGPNPIDGKVSPGGTMTPGESYHLESTQVLKVMV